MIVKLKCFFLVILLSVCNFQSELNANSFINDSIKKSLKFPQHYFPSIVFTNFYYSSERVLGSSQGYNSSFVSERLKTLQYSQVNNGFLIPLYTIDRHSNDSASISNWHFLIAGNFLNAFPMFSGISKQHVFCRYSLGLRSMYNNGKKDVFFLDVSPFLAYDYGYSDRAQLRFSNTFLWSHIFSEKFSFRLGVTQSFIFGDRLLLPMMGFRLGRLDRVYVSIQFPRNLNVNIPINKSVTLNLIAKPIGNIFDFKDYDSIYFGSSKRLFFGWRDVCVGGGFDYHPVSYITCFLHLGFTSKASNVSFYSRSSNQDPNFTPYKWFYNESLERGTFLNFSLSFKFGQIKMSGGNQSFNELSNINSDIDPGNINAGTQNNIISISSRVEKSAIRINDISDIINDVDLYD